MSRSADQIAEMVASQGSFEFAWRSEAAYTWFSEGGVIISEDPADLEAFAEKNKSEFWGDQIERGPNGQFRHFEAMGQKFYFTYHKHKTREEFSKKLQQIEAEGLHFHS